MADTESNITRPSGHAAHVANLFHEHNRALIAFLQCRLNSVHDAQELAQEAYARMLALERPDQVDSSRAYLFRIAANLAFDRSRMRQVRDNASIEPPAADAQASYAPERHAAAVQQWDGIREALRELPKKTSRAFVMHMIEKHDFSVIARAMKLSERMVRYHVTNALAHCRARVDDLEIP